MVELPKGYTEEDCLQHGLHRQHRPRTEVDVRTPFQHDVDRILYSGEFRALAGKTQVVASDQFGNYHNRLTHSLKVAQIGKRLATLLTEHAREDGNGETGPDPDLVEAACLLHDIGHPPFGHIGEREVAARIDALWGSRENASGQEAAGQHDDGFQANAQNLRIAAFLAVRQNTDPRGLHLSRAVLDAATKYPWHRGEPDTYGAKAWGCYASEDDHLRWILRGAAIPDAPVTEDAAPERPVEEQIMDWADEVTYACHDVEDFYRAGLIPLGDVLQGLPRRRTDPRPGASSSLEHETRRFVEYLESRGYDQDEVLDALVRVQNTVGEVFPYEDTQAVRGSAAAATSSLLAYFLGRRTTRELDDGIPRKVRLEPVSDSLTLTGYGARLYVDPELRKTCDVLKRLIRCYVIDRPSLATQQQGQRRILGDLLDWYAHDPARLLPAQRREEYQLHGDAIRAAADTVSALTEGEAVRVHRRMSGIDYGQVTDLR